MAITSRQVPAPEEGLYRIAKDIDPFTFWPPRSPLDLAAPDLDGNRFDDPNALYASIYCATDLVGAFGETIARYRPSEGLLDRISAFLEDAPDSEYDPPLHAGKVPSDYFAGRYIGHGTFDPSVSFVDVEHPDTHSSSAFGLAQRLQPFTAMRTVDRGTMHHQDRRVTRTVARYFYDMAQTADHPDLRGLRYESRIFGPWECWIVWEPSPLLPGAATSKVTRTNPALLQAAELLGIEI